MTPTPRTVRLNDEVTIEYVEQGQPGGTPVLLLHGASDSWHSFELVLPHLPKDLHIFALSLRGHGDSSRPDTGYRPADFAADVVAFMDAVEIEAAVLAGHSSGSLVARHVAIDHPDRVLGLVLISAFASMHDNPGAQEVQEAVMGLGDPVDPGFVREFQESTLARPIPEEFFETIMRESLKLPSHVWQGLVAGAMEDRSVSDVGEIRAPTLIVWGDQDGFVPRSDQELLADRIPNARLVVYEGTGHAVHWEEPQRFASDLEKSTHALVH